MKKTIKAIHRIAAITLAVIMGAAMTSCVGFPGISFPIIIAGGDGGGYSGGSQPAAMQTPRSAAAQAPTLDKLKFTAINGATAASVTAINKQISGAVVIPDVYEGLPVTTIPAGAFQSTQITSLTIPASVTRISNSTVTSTNNGPLVSVTFLGDPNSISFTANGGFQPDLINKALAGGPGTYTRAAGSNIWSKQ